MTTIGILGGTGPAGRSLAARLADLGHTVVLGSRSGSRATEAVSALLGRWPERNLAIEAGGNENAAAADVVVVATPWEGAAEVARSVSGLLHGKVVISMANALVHADGEFLPLVSPRGSVAASVQAAVPDSLVAAAMHHLPAKELGMLDRSVDADVLICSDHPTATACTAEIIGGMPGVRALDAGALSNAMAIEAFTAVLLQLNARYRTRTGLALTGLTYGGGPQ